MDNFDMRFWQRSRRVPVVRQTEVSECGLSALAMVCAFHGRDIDLRLLRQQFPASTRGSSLRSLIEVASKLGLQTRAVRAELEELRQLTLPCVLHWNMNHFVVLVRVSKRHCIIHDPGRGRIKCSLDEVSRSFSGAALEIWPSSSFRKSKRREGTQIDWRALTGKIAGYKASMLQVFGLAVFLQFIALTMPAFSQVIIDKGLGQSNVGLLAAVAVAYAMLTVVSVLVMGIRSWLVTYIRTEMYFAWSKNIFAHLLKLPQSYFEQRHMGDLLSRFNSIASIQQTLSTSLVEAALDGILVVATLAMMFVYSVALTLIPALACVLYGVVRVLMYPATLEANFKQITYSAKQQGRVIEGIRSHQTVKVTNAQALVAGRFLNTLSELSNSQIAVQRQTIITDGASKLIFGFARLGMYCYGAFLALSGHLTPGAVIAFIAYATQFSDRVVSFVDYCIQLRLLNLQGGRLEDIVIAEQEKNLVTDFVGAPMNTNLALREISFRYSPEDPWILKGCSLEIRAGEIVAIVGVSGVGKTTLMKIIMGLIEPVGGDVRFGTLDINQIGKLAYRGMIGAVMQDNEFFGGTIGENICLFDAAPDQQRIEEAARLAMLHEDILALPLGYRTRIGGIGSNLSAGQRQRLALARTFYQRPKLLVLDEATCHIDTGTEAAIAENIRALNVATILVTHRRESYLRADRVISLDNGMLKAAALDFANTAMEQVRSLVGSGR